MEIEERIPSKREANVSNLLLMRRIVSFSRERRIVESHREVSQAVLLHEDRQGYFFTVRCRHASGWELGSHIGMT